MLKNHKKTSVLNKALGWTVGTACLGWASIASAAPADIAGSWSITGNQSVGLLSISQGLSVSACKPISGRIYANNPIQGYYCPASGRISFKRLNTANQTSQMWIGNVGDVVTGQSTKIGGTFHSVDTAAGSGTLGEYPFYGQKL